MPKVRVAAKTRARARSGLANTAGLTPVRLAPRTELRIGISGWRAGEFPYAEDLTADFVLHSISRRGKALRQRLQ